jgi:ferric-dicitrate binding protein FerR (iron transport regulator)
MERDPESNDDDAALVARHLRALPPRRAPASLAPRVLGEIARREALPWWRRPPARWPRVPQLGLILACAASVPLAWRSLAWLAAGGDLLTRRAGLPVATLRDLLHAALAAQSSLRLIDGAVPPSWLLAGLAFAGALYGALLGLGAIAYRQLYLQP